VQKKSGGINVKAQPAQNPAEEAKKITQEVPFL
jgi:hypothetical protein